MKQPVSLHRMLDSEFDHYGNAYSHSAWMWTRYSKYIQDEKEYGQIQILRQIRWMTQCRAWNLLFKAADCKRFSNIIFNILPHWSVISSFSSANLYQPIRPKRLKPWSSNHIWISGIGCCSIMGFLLLNSTQSLLTITLQPAFRCLVIPTIIWLSCFYTEHLKLFSLLIPLLSAWNFSRPLPLMDYYKQKIYIYTIFRAPPYPLCNTHWPTPETHR